MFIFFSSDINIFSLKLLLLYFLTLVLKKLILFRKRHSNLSEAEIIQLAKKQQEYFGLLYEKYFEQIFRFVFKRLSGDEETAGDLTQQTFIKAMANMDKYTDKGLPFSSWLYRIAQNEVSMHFRSAKKTITVSVEQTAVLGLLDEVTTVHHMSMDEQEKLVKLLNELDPEQSDLIELRYFQGVNFKEISEIYNITEANAKMRVYRILDKLKSKWEAAK